MVEAVQMAGNLVQGVAGYETGKFNRAMSETEAVEAERTGTVEEGRVRDAARMAIGAQLAAQGSNGFQMGTGSALDALQQSQINAALDGLTVRQNAAARARSARTEGKIAYAKGENDLVAAGFGAAAAAAQTRSDWASSRTGSTPPPKGRG